MNAFIIYSTYEAGEDGAKLHIFGKQEDGRAFLAIVPYRPYFYIKASDLPLARGFLELESEETDFVDFNGNKLARIYAQSPKDVPAMRQLLEDNDIKCYEADIPFVSRFLIDKDIRGCCSISGKRRSEGMLDIYDEAVLEPAECSVKLKILSLDIETSQDASEIYCISLFTEGYSKVMMVSGEQIPELSCFASEKELLAGFVSEINAIDPDIITGWNVIDFDLSVISQRCRRHKVKLAIGRNSSEARVRTSDSFMKDSSCTIPGRVVLDGLALLRSSFVKVDDYKLDAVAKEILNEGKAIDSKVHKGRQIDEWFRNDKKQLAEYNLKDAELVYRILEKKNIIYLTIRRSTLTGLPLDRVKQSIMALDSLYLRESKKQHLAADCVGHDGKDELVKGAYVMEPEPGLYNYVIVLDFISLYPNVIRTFNIDPLSFGKGDDIIAPNGARFSGEEAILPMIIENLTAGRAEFKKAGDATGSYAIKIHMNSIYGALGNPNCRFYSLDIANAITSFARDIIHKTIEQITAAGAKVIYSDTDSVFIASGAKSYEEALDIGKKLQASVNSYFDSYVSKNFKRKSYLYLEHDKTFRRFYMPKQRNVETGAKKRYAGLLVKDGVERISYTGIELMRRDWTDLAKKFQLELLDRVFHDREVEAYITEFVKDLKDGKMDDLLVYKKSLRKPVEQYTKSTPPHVKAALLMEGLGKGLIYYRQTVNGPEPVENQKSRIDYQHYIDKQLAPIADSILNLMGKSFKDIAQGRQRNLFEY